MGTSFSLLRHAPLERDKLADIKAKTGGHLSGRTIQRLYQQWRTKVGHAEYVSSSSLRQLAEEEFGNVYLADLFLKVTGARKAAGVTFEEYVSAWAVFVQPKTDADWFTGLALMISNDDGQTISETDMKEFVGMAWKHDASLDEAMRQVQADDAVLKLINDMQSFGPITTPLTVREWVRRAVALSKGEALEYPTKTDPSTRRRLVSQAQSDGPTLLPAHQTNPGAGSNPTSRR